MEIPQTSKLLESFLILHDFRIIEDIGDVCSHLTNTKYIYYVQHCPCCIIVKKGEKWIRKHNHTINLKWKKTCWL